MGLVIVSYERGNMLYLSCDFCEKPIYGAYQSAFCRDKAGNPQDVRFLHWKCRNVLKHMQPNKGWENRGHPAMSIRLDNNSQSTSFEDLGQEIDSVIVLPSELVLTIE